MTPGTTDGSAAAFLFAHGDCWVTGLEESPLRRVPRVHDGGAGWAVPTGLERRPARPVAQRFGADAATRAPVRQWFATVPMPRKNLPDIPVGDRSRILGNVARP